MGAGHEVKVLGKVTESGHSPTLYDTDQDMYVIQGWVISDPAALSELAMPAGGTAVLVPKALMRQLPEGEHGAAST